MVSASGVPDRGLPGATCRSTSPSVSTPSRPGPALVVEDARAEESLRASPAVAEMGVVAYVGVPLLDPDGRALGTLCVADTAPRRWTEAELADLHDLAAIATAELHRRLGESAEPAPGAVVTAVRLSYDAIPVMIWTVTAEGTCDYVNARWLEFTGRCGARTLPDGSRQGHDTGDTRRQALAPFLGPLFPVSLLDCRYHRQTMALARRR